MQGNGYYVRQKYGDQYYAIAFDTFKGSVNVLDEDRFESHSFVNQPGSFSALFAGVKLSVFFIPFNNTKDNPLYNVDGNITNLFANWGERRALPIRPGIDFNALIFIRETTHSVPLN